MTYGLAEFIAAEEMGRMRGYWWSPDGDRAAGRAGRRVAGAALAHRRPGQPDRPAAERRYPAAGTANAEVALFVLGLDGVRGSRCPSTGRVPGRPPPGTRTACRSCTCRGTSGRCGCSPSTRRPARTTLVARGHRPGLGGPRPRRARATCRRHAGLGRRRRRRPPPDRRRRAGHPARAAGARGARRRRRRRARSAASGEPTEIAPVGLDPARRPDPVSPPSPACYTGRTRGRHVCVVTGRPSTREGVSTAVLPHGAPAAVTIASYAERPGLDLRVTLLRAGERELATAVLLPVLARARLRAAAGADGPVRRAARPAGARRAADAT